MPHVTVTVNGRSYKMGCRDGEESRIQDLVAEIEAHVQRIKGSTRLVPDDRLFLMAAIMLADQLWDTREELNKALKHMADFRSYQVIDGGSYVAPRDLNRITEPVGVKMDVIPHRNTGG